MAQLEKLRQQLGETDVPSTKTPTLRHQQNLGASSARGPPGLDQYYRAKDLRALGIVPNWPTLSSWIRERGFPPGILLSPRIRCWSRQSIQDFLDKQKTA
jgi:hypothetical protein